MKQEQVHQILSTKSIIYACCLKNICFHAKLHQIGPSNEPNLDRTELTSWQNHQKTMVDWTWKLRLAKQVMCHVTHFPNLANGWFCILFLTKASSSRSYFRNLNLLFSFCSFSFGGWKQNLNFGYEFGRQKKLWHEKDVMKWNEMTKQSGKLYGVSNQNARVRRGTWMRRWWGNHHHY